MGMESEYMGSLGRTVLFQGFSVSLLLAAPASDPDVSIIACELPSLQMTMVSSPPRPLAWQNNTAGIPRPPAHVYVVTATLYGSTFLSSA